MDRTMVSLSPGGNSLHIHWPLTMSLRRLPLTGLALPGDLLGEACVERSLGAPAEVAFDLGGVGDGRALIARTSGLPAQDGASAGDRFELFEDIPHGCGL